MSRTVKSIGTDSRLGVAYSRETWRVMAEGVGFLLEWRKCSEINVTDAQLCEHTTHAERRTGDG